MVTVNASNASQAVKWKTNISNIATVDKYGKVTAKSVGSPGCMLEQQTVKT